MKRHSVKVAVVVLVAAVVVVVVVHLNHHDAKTMKDLIVPSQAPTMKSPARIHRSMKDPILLLLSMKFEQNSL